MQHLNLNLIVCNVLFNTLSSENMMRVGWVCWIHGFIIKKAKQKHHISMSEWYSDAVTEVFSCPLKSIYREAKMATSGLSWALLLLWWSLI